jgi:membrane-associated protease RseP (regulator of RpoE activity)
MRFPRLLSFILVAALAATACSSKSGDVESVKRSLEGDQSSKASTNVKPPPAANPRLTARVGLILATNSRTWQRMLQSPTDAGVAVLFVQPGGPAAETDIQRGDVVTEVDGKAVPNAERAVVLLRARPDERRTIKITKVGGGTKDVVITPKVPGDVNLINLYTSIIQKTPDDAVLYFLRGQVQNAPFDQALADSEKAVDLQPGFVEAISLRAELRWNRARVTKDANKVQELRDQAMQDWGTAHQLDPQNTRVLVSRAQALAVLGNARSARADGEKARALDPQFPGAHYTIGQADFILSKYAAAAEPARVAIDLNPYDVRYYKLLALVFMRLGRRSDARKTVDAIIDLVDSASSREDLLKVVQPK